jgi:cytochrome c-type biogenesis protein CcmE
MNPTTRRRVFQVLLALAIIALVVAQGLLEVNPNH